MSPIKCKDCDAVRRDDGKGIWTCGCTGAQVVVNDTSPDMPNLSSRRDQRIRARNGDRENMICPATLDRMVGSEKGREIVVGVMSQVIENGEIDLLLSLYSDTQANKLRDVWGDEMISRQAARMKRQHGPAAAAGW